MLEHVYDVYTPNKRGATCLDDLFFCVWLLCVCEVLAKQFRETDFR